MSFMYLLQKHSSYMNIPAESFGSIKSNPKEIIKQSEKLDTVRKETKTVSHTLIRPKNICLIYIIYFAAVHVKLKELNLIIGKVKKSKVGTGAR